MDFCGKVVYRGDFNLKQKLLLKMAVLLLFIMITSGSSDLPNEEKINKITSEGYSIVKGVGIEKDKLKNAEIINVKIQNMNIFKYVRNK